MFKILIVEDDTDKLKYILQLLEKIPQIEIDKVDHEIDVQSAKKRMLSTFYDLLILDILVPLTKYKDVDPKGGILLLEEILSRGIYKVPTHIFGLTAADEKIFEATRAKFEETILTLIRYSQSDIEWQDKLISGINHRIASKEMADLSDPTYDYEVAIICALKSELDANLANGWCWQQKEIVHDDTIYYEAAIKIGDKTIRVIAACSLRMGMPATGALTMKMLIRFKPMYAVMTGIMAGVTGRVQLGDIVVIDPSWDWGSGKWISQEEKNSDKIKNSLFLIDPYQFTVDTKIKKEIGLLADDKNYLFNLRNNFGIQAPKHDINIHVGAVASGAAVLSDSITFNKIKEQHRKLLGIEMEAYAFYSAAECTSRPKPTPVCIKSVVDFGDSDKDDDYQYFGSYASATVAKNIIEKLFK